MQNRSVWKRKQKQKETLLDTPALESFIVVPILLKQSQLLKDLDQVLHGPFVHPHQVYLNLLPSRALPDPQLYSASDGVVSLEALHHITKINVDAIDR